MKMFSDCSGPCDRCITHYDGGCLAGHGDDDFCQVDKKCFNRLMEKDLLNYQKEQLVNNFPEFVNKE